MISIIIPTYNRAGLIKKSIMSILNQTYKDFEIIVVDDNSTDDTEAAVKKIKDNRIRYIKHEKNKGANAARNTGINNALGELIAFQDSDDEWLENKLEIQMKELKESKADITACSFFLNADGKTRIVPDRNIQDEEISERIYYGNFISTQTILGKKECFISDQFDEAFPRFQDWELLMRLSGKYNIHFINRPLVNVYVQENSISKDHKKAITALRMIMEKYQDYLAINKKALASIYYHMGLSNTEMKNYEHNYYKDAVRYNPLEIKYIKRMLKFEVEKFRQK